MGRIGSEAAARRLARAIVSDLRLYHEEKIQAGQDVSDEIDEGRRLFRQRVEASFYPLFEAALSELLPETASAASSTAAVSWDAPDPGTAIPAAARGARAASRGIPEGFLREEKPAADRGSWGCWLVAMVVLILGAVAAAAVLYAAAG
jgi:hypothetical protein